MSEELEREAASFDGVNDANSGVKTGGGVLASLKLFKDQYKVAFATVALPIIGFAYGSYYIMQNGLPLFYMGVWALMHFLGMIGISVGFHRLAAHASFKGTKWTKRGLLILGSMSAQGPVIYWTTNHRRHHHKCDQPGDVHSPYFSEAGEEFKSRTFGLLQAHCGWMFRSNPSNPIKYSKDLLSDPDVLFVNRHYYKWIILGVVFPGVLSFLFFRTLESFLIGMLIGGVMRVFTVQHVTWAINSLTHMFGGHPFDSHDRSSNLFWLSMPSAGEAWHNNHHTFPYSARLGLFWWQLDPGWWLLQGLKAIGLVSDLKVPTPEMIESKRVVSGA